MVNRVYVEKKKGLDNEAKSLLKDARELLNISGLEDVRLLNRYDVEDIDQDLFNYAVSTVFSEPQIDNVSYNIPESDFVFAVEYLPGQFDQRATSAAECIQLISQKDRPLIRSAKVYILKGNLNEDELAQIKKYVINPVEARLADLDLPQTLKVEYEVPEDVKTLEGFNNLDEAGLNKMLIEMGLAMDLADLKFCQDYFKSENRDPSVTEIKVIDTYWSDHCRHTTFNTILDEVKFIDPVLEESYQRYLNTRADLNRTKPITLMDLGTIAAKALKKAGKLDKLDESEEINACTIKCKVTVDGAQEDWLLLFKNETHNHPTEIEPFGGAATCIGGAIRDPLSGRGYVYAAMRITGAGDPLTPLEETIEGKLPQRKIVQTAAAGYSSYGNQIGLCTGLVDEIYHPGYTAKRMEVGAVVAAAKEENVIRKRPKEGDVVILLGGKTGRDGCGGATGSSKSHSVSSLETCGAEVQKGNAPEERKLQRLFRNPEASKMILRCNDFGAGGVSVAIGELADGLEVDLNKVPKKYEGLNGTELAISESQERMAVVVDPKDVDAFIKLAKQENLETSVVAHITAEPRLVLKHNGKDIVNIKREFLDSNGAEKHVRVNTCVLLEFDKEDVKDFKESYLKLADDLNVCSKRGLSERFDSTIGTGTVLAPFGGKYQRTPIQTMVHKISDETRDTKTVSLMSYGYNPYVMEKDPYRGAYLAVVESVAKLIAVGGENKDIYLSFQEYFERLNKDADKWGVPFAAMLGALDAQLDLEIAAIGGKDSMSGTFENIHVPPTLISFAVTVEDIDSIISNEFKSAGNNVYLVKPHLNEKKLPEINSLKKVFEDVHTNIQNGRVISAHTPGYGGVAEAILKMSMGNKIGFEYEDVDLKEIFNYNYGAFVLETSGDLKVDKEMYDVILLGKTVEDTSISRNGEAIELDEITGVYENKLESVYSCNIKQGGEEVHNVRCEKVSDLKSPEKFDKPLVLIPVFPGTNCEYDTAKAFEKAGAKAQIFVINNQSAEDVSKSVEEFAKAIGKAQIIFIPGGFSGGDEPDGSAKFITAFFRNASIKSAVEEFLDVRKGLMGGICNGFQALIKLGLVPYGKIVDTDENSATLTFNQISRHQSKLVSTRVSSLNSPWLKNCNLDTVYNVAISHGEGRFMANPELIQRLEENGQIITQYTDLNGNATNDIQYNPNGSDLAIEGICSPDGRIFGKMGHSERIGYGLYKNVVGEMDMQLFKSAVEYFK